MVGSRTVRLDQQRGPVRYGIAILLILPAIYLRVLLTPFLGTKSLFPTAWVVIVITSWYLGIGPSVVAVAVGVVGTWFWILSPHGTVSAQDAFVMMNFVVISGLIIAIGAFNRSSRSKLIAAETEAKRAKTLFEAFMDNSPALTYLKDETGRYLYTNRAASKRFPFSEILGKTDLDLFPQEIAAEIRAHDRMVLDENHAREFTEHTLEEDGKHTWLAVKFPLIDGEGKRVLAGKSFDITDRQRAEEALQPARQELEARVEQRTSELSRANDSLRDLSARLLQMRDDERRRLARELHDSAGQLLAAIRMNMALVKAEANQLSSSATQALTENEKIVEQISREIRTMSHLLHPPLLDEAGLRSALSWFVQEFSQRSKIDVSLEISQSFTRLDAELETAIFRIVQECLTNIHRHSGSKSAAIRIAQESQRILVSVQDAGKGIPSHKLDLHANGRGGVGFRGMAERLRYLGGHLEIHSDPNGTVVTAALPFEDDSSNARGQVVA